MYQIVPLSIRCLWKGLRVHQTGAVYNIIHDFVYSVHIDRILILLFVSQTTELESFMYLFPHAIDFISLPGHLQMDRGCKWSYLSSAKLMIQRITFGVDFFVHFIIVVFLVSINLLPVLFITLFT